MLTFKCRQSATRAWEPDSRMVSSRTKTALSHHLRVDGLHGQWMACVRPRRVGLQPRRRSYCLASPTARPCTEIPGRSAPRTFGDRHLIVPDPFVPRARRSSWFGRCLLRREGVASVTHGASRRRFVRRVALRPVLGISGVLAKAAVRDLVAETQPQSSIANSLRTQFAIELAARAAVE
jgi:hypothetical protein